MAQLSVAPPTGVRRRWFVSEVLFDMDGTLVDSINAVESSWAVWAREEGIDLGLVRKFHGRTAEDLIADLVAPHRSGAAARRLTEIETEISVPIPLKPGARSLVESIPADRWAIVTSAAGPVARARIAASALPTPSLLITADDVDFGKPDPEPFRRAQRWGIGTERALAFEDTASGLDSASAAGCIAVGVVGTENVEQLRGHADALVASLEDVSVMVADDGRLQVEIVLLQEPEGTGG
ncbi:HAD family hydrolase [Microbacterium kribbense]|uniref:HAD family hydrolase n=1 Tax=Microbacterium kribbense TaxID=433645 RepID=A0ABP7GID8_9MICO